MPGRGALDLDPQMMMSRISGGNSREAELARKKKELEMMRASMESARGSMMIADGRDRSSPYDYQDVSGLEDEIGAIEASLAEEKANRENPYREGGPGGHYESYMDMPRGPEARGPRERERWVADMNYQPPRMGERPGAGEIPGPNNAEDEAAKLKGVNDMRRRMGQPPLLQWGSPATGRGPASIDAKTQLEDVLPKSYQTYNEGYRIVPSAERGMDPGNVGVVYPSRMKNSPAGGYIEKGLEHAGILDQAMPQQEMETEGYRIVPSAERGLSPGNVGVAYPQRLSSSPYKRIKRK